MWRYSSTQTEFLQVGVHVHNVGDALLGKVSHGERTVKHSLLFEGVVDK